MAGWDRASSCCEASTLRKCLVGEHPYRLPSIALLAPVATEDTRRHALMPFEGDTEVREVRIADAGGNLFDRQASVEQKGARHLVELRQHEGANAYAEHRLEIARQPEGVVADDLSELVDGRRVLELGQQTIACAHHPVDIGCARARERGHGTELVNQQLQHLRLDVELA